MRKIYSLVLMAMMLLVGTNAWAGLITVTHVTGTYASSQEMTSLGLQDAISKVAAGDSATITLSADEELSNVVIINGQKILLDMAGNEINENGITSGAGKGCFALLKGTLHLHNGTVNHNKADAGNNVGRSAIFVSGAGWDHKTTVWSTLIVDEDVKILTTTGKLYGITLDILNSTVMTALGNPSNVEVNSLQDQASQPDGKCAIKDKYNNWDSGSAFGVRMLIKGDILAHHRGINIAGNINSEPSCDGTSSLYPFIKVYPTSEIRCYSDGLESGNGGIYAGGYCVMEISGYVHGQNGIFVKSGDIDLIDATVASDSQYSYGSGDYEGNVAGKGVIIASDAGYAGDVNVTISGSTTVSAGTNSQAQAIVDLYASNTTTTQVSHLDITGGTIEGNIELTTGTGEKTQVTGGELEGNVTVGETSGATAISQIVPTSSHTTTVEDPVTHQITTVVSTGAAPANDATIDGYLNGDGLATFSASDNYTLTGVTAWKATGFSNGILTLAEVTGNIPAGTGVILYGTAGKPYEFTVNKTTVAGAGTNILKPSTAWNTSLENVYILHGDELWLYTGTTFPANKAFVQLTPQQLSGNQAPQRIRMVFNQQENATAVENVEAESIKAVKFMGEDGQLYIRRGDVVYTVQGQVVK